MRFLSGLETDREARVVHEHVDRCELGRQRVDRAEHGGAVPHVERERVDPVAEFALQFREPFHAASRGNHARPVPREAPRRRLTETRGRTRHENDHHEP